MLSSVAASVNSLASARADRRTDGAILNRMRTLGPVCPEIVALIQGLRDAQALKAGAELISERDLANKPRFLISGWAARVRWLPDGRRQIVSLVLPGEALGLCLRPSPLALCTTVALTTVQVFDAAPVQRAVLDPDPRWSGLRDLIHISASLDEAYLLNNIVRLGRQTAYERMCHLLLEIHERLAMAGVGEGDSFPMPLIQEMLADATGLSIVHANRTLQHLRREHLLDLHGGRARLLDRAALDAIADYRRPAPSMARAVAHDAGS
jgi:CRP-like cAMP-binding protein